MKRKLIVITLVAFTSVLGLYFGLTSGGEGNSDSTNNSGEVKETETPEVQPAPTPDVSAIIDGSVRYQTIDNFGASDAWSMEPLGKHWTEENKNQVADLLFSREKGIGLSAWRFNIGAGSSETDQSIIPDPWRRSEAFKSSETGDYDWSKQAGQQWFLQAAKDRGVNTLIAFANSPPVWMTKNGHAQPDPDVGSTNLKDDYEDEFATYLVDVLEHFKQEGLEFQYISPINEPTWDWNRRAGLTTLEQANIRSISRNCSEIRN
ncbi:glycoside hydrolase [Paenibacillus sp. MCAF20]